jgi:hypothetical protein
MCLDEVPKTPLETSLFIKSRADYNSNSWPQLKHGYPLNLSILIRGGKETNRDALSNGE